MEQRLAIAIDLGGTSIKSALVAESGEILKKAQTPTEADNPKEVVVGNLLSAIEKVYDEKALGIGIGSPGWVNPESGSVNWIENIPCLNGVSFSEAIHKKYDIPVFVDNDATNAAKGQYLFGSGKGAKIMLGITLGTGVGGGLIINGKAFGGVINYAGEIGHITYIPDGMACTCGKRGCLEAYASATALERSAMSILKRRIESALLEYDSSKITAKLVCDLAKAGDAVCGDLVQEAGKALGVVIGGIINLLNLDKVVIGGGVAAAGDILFDQIRIYASRHALPYAYNECEIIPGTLGNDAGILGSAATVFMEL